MNYMPCRSTGLCHLDLHTNFHPALAQIVDEYSMLFSGYTNITLTWPKKGLSDPVAAPGEICICVDFVQLNH